MDLSIIITHFQTPDLTDELLIALMPQIKSNVQVLVIDASNNYDLDKYDVDVMHIKDKGLCYSRNVGIDLAKGKYFTFIDGDDMVSNNYVNKILHQIKEKEFDRCYFSWRFRNLKTNIVIKDTPPDWNWAIWNCVYRKDWIGNTRFDESLKFAEDVPFQRELRKKPYKRANITDILYIYYDNRLNSNSQKQIEQENIQC